MFVHIWWNLPIQVIYFVKAITFHRIFSFHHQIYLYIIYYPWSNWSILYSYFKYHLQTNQPINSWFFNFRSRFSQILIYKNSFILLHSQSYTISRIWVISVQIFPYSSCYFSLFIYFYNFFILFSEYFWIKGELSFPFVAALYLHDISFLIFFIFRNSNIFTIFAWFSHYTFRLAIFIVTFWYFIFNFWIFDKKWAYNLFNNNINSGYLLNTFIVSKLLPLQLIIRLFHVFILI